MLVVSVLVLLCRLYGTRTVFWLPLLLTLASAVLIELAAYLLIRQTVTLLENLFSWGSEQSKCIALMHNASDYASWSALAQRMDQITGKQAWKEVKESRAYDWTLISALTNTLQHARESQDASKLIDALHAAVERNIGGIFSEMLYSKTFVGTKSLIEEFLGEVLLSLETFAAMKLPADARKKALRIAEAWRLLHPSPEELHGESKSSEFLDSRVSESEPEIPSFDRLEEESVLANQQKQNRIAKLRFLTTLKMSFGEPALCLSGGAGLALYHVGLVRAMVDSKCLPRIISGTSAGAAFAIIICTMNDDELDQFWTAENLAPLLTPFDEPLGVLLGRFIKKGHLFDSVMWTEKMKLLIKKDYTFLEAFQRTGRVLNITVSSSRKFGAPRLLNYVSAPNVLVTSAALASTALPFLIKPMRLKEKLPNGSIIEREDGSGLWRDGSFEVDIPIQPLSELFLARFFIVSQTNPHVIPFFFYGRGESGRPSLWRDWTGAWRGGFLLSALEVWLKEDMKKNLRVIRKLDLLPPLFGQDWSNIFLQEFHGDVTVIPRPSIRDYFNLLRNPSLQEVAGFMKRGQHYTWRKMSLIRNRMCINQALDQCIDSVKSGKVSFLSK